MSQLTNQIAVVTGAGRGIGRAIALKFAQEGADVAVVSRTQENSEKVANEIRALGRKAWAHAVDVADSAAVSAAAEQILAEAGKDSSHTNIVLPFDRGTLASHIGTTRENLSRNLAQLTEYGVRIRGREIMIDDRELLAVLGKNARVRALRDFDQRRVIQQTLDVYAELLPPSEAAMPRTSLPH